MAVACSFKWFGKRGRTCHHQVVSASVRGSPRARRLCHLLCPLRALSTTRCCVSPAPGLLNVQHSRTIFSISVGLCFNIRFKVEITNNTFQVLVHEMLLLRSVTQHVSRAILPEPWVGYSELNWQVNSKVILNRIYFISLGMCDNDEEKCWCLQQFPCNGEERKTLPMCNMNL